MVMQGQSGGQGLFRSRYVIQKWMPGNEQVWEETREMYCRSEGRIARDPDEAGCYILTAGEYDFCTYFNALSLRKWKKYTCADNFFLELEIQGDFRIDLTSMLLDNIGGVHEELLSSYLYRLSQRTRLILPFPDRGGKDPELAGFRIEALGECRIWSGCYAAQAPEKELRDPRITMVTTTFRKESYVKNNVRLMEETVFVDPELADHFNWKIIDNGRTLDPADFPNEKITIIPNRNTGGSGGFCRGMMEVLDDAALRNMQATHVLLMDDDVSFMPESFYRLFHLLKLLKPEYDSCFISGAMLEINQRNVQHEDVGRFSLQGAHGPAKPRFDLTVPENPVRNETDLPEDVHYYAGWWFCCIPASFIREDNLPMPFFIRGDDVEYSIRNHAKFITMNGICIWHEGFGTKFSASMELYQVHRNDLILQTVNPSAFDVDVIDRMKNLFWEEIFKFNYKGCSLLLDAVEDFLKGPEYLKSLDGEACMREKKGKDNRMMPVTAEIRQMINYNTLYQLEPLTGLRLKWYGHFVNGQKLPEWMAGDKTAVIPYGWGYSQRKLEGARTVIAVDSQNDLYVIYTRDKTEFKKQTARFRTLMQRFDREYPAAAEAYRSEFGYMTGRQFWEAFLQK